MVEQIPNADNLFEAEKVRLVLEALGSDQKILEVAEALVDKPIRALKVETEVGVVEISAKAFFDAVLGIKPDKTDE